MGLFSSKKIVSVASTLYNLAGPEEDRPNFLKTSLFGAVMSDQNPFIGETVVQTHFTGPGMDQRLYFNWAKRNGNFGLPTASINRQIPADPLIVAPHIPTPSSPSGLELHILNAYVMDGDFSVFAEKWLLENHPEKVALDWTADYLPDTSEIIIQYPDNSTDIFTEPGFDKDARYVMANYFHALPQEVQPLVQGTRQTDIPAGSLPDQTGFTQDSLANDVSNDYTLDRNTHVLVEYSDSTPDEESDTPSTVEQSWTTTLEVLSKTVFDGGDGEGFTTVSTEHFLNIWNRRQVTNDYYVQTVEVEDIGGGVTKTTTTTVTGEQLSQIYDYREDFQETWDLAIVGGDQIYLYKTGNGIAALDALAQDQDISGFAEFYPFIPLRLDNLSIRNPVYTTNGLFDDSASSFRKAFKNQTLDDLVDTVEDNPSLADIDFAYVCFGVSLNTKDNACKKYIYQFFKALEDYQHTTSADYTAFKNQATNTAALYQTLNNWVDAQSDPLDPLYNTPRPGIPVLQEPKASVLQLRSNDGRVGAFDLRLSFINVDETVHSGVYGSLSKGSVLVQKGESFTWTTRVGVKEKDLPMTYRSVNHEIQNLEIIWQTSDSSYKKLVVAGLTHRNLIYGGKSVDISAHQALDDPEPSGFLVPLHSPTIRAMSLVDATQITTSSSHVLINSYQITKQKWYQRGIFKILIVIAAIVISVLTVNPGAAGAAAGLLGTNLAVGTALGFAGTAAIVAGAIANGLAALVVSQIISEVSVELFGEKIGAIIGAIASFAVSFGFSDGFAGGFNWEALTSANNLLKFSNVLANGYSGWVQAEISEIHDQMQVNQTSYEQETKRISQLIADLGGQNDLNFNPMFLTDSVQGNGSNSSSGYLPESLDEFIRRTTMVGTDIVEITHNMIYNYATLSLTLPKN